MSRLGIVPIVPIAGAGPRLQEIGEASPQRPETWACLKKLGRIKRRVDILPMGHGNHDNGRRLILKGPPWSRHAAGTCCYVGREMSTAASAHGLPPSQPHSPSGAGYECSCEAALIAHRAKRARTAAHVPLDVDNVGLVRANKYIVCMRTSGLLDVLWVSSLLYRAGDNISVRFTMHRSTNHGGATTTGLDATHPPTIFQNSPGGGGGGGGGGAQLGGSSRGSGGGVPPGGRGGGCSCRGSGGGCSCRGAGGGSGRGSWGCPATGEGGGGGWLGLGLRSPSWWNQSWFYNPF